MVTLATKRASDREPSSKVEVAGAWSAPRPWGEPDTVAGGHPVARNHWRDRREDTWVADANNWLQNQSRKMKLVLP